jgi:hypothetical protein
MVDWNPAPHVRHAWESAKTVYGKIALVLFYSLIWFGILSSAWSVIFPESQGAQCILGTMSKSATDKSLMIDMIRAVNVLWVGFFMYADVGGYKVKNVAMVTIFICAFMLAGSHSIRTLKAGACGNVLAQMLVYPAWAVVALLFAIIDDKMADHGTTEERQNLVV